MATMELSALKSSKPSIMHGALAEIFPRDALNPSRLQFRCAAFKFSEPDGFRLRQLKTLEQLRRHFSAVGFNQFQCRA